MKFCCLKFKDHYESGKIYDGEKLIKELYPNIKIVKLETNQYNEGKNLFRYLIVCGFLKDTPPILNISHCPFCGTDLFDFYKSDEYINEKAKTFSLE